MFCRAGGIFAGNRDERKDAPFRFQKGADTGVTRARAWAVLRLMPDFLLADYAEMLHSRFFLMPKSCVPRSERCEY